MNVFTKQKQTHRHRQQTGYLGRNERGVWDEQTHTMYETDTQQVPAVRHRKTTDNIL